MIKTVMQNEYYINATSHTISNSWWTDFKHKLERNSTQAASQTT